MFGILENLTKAVIGVAIKTPIAIVADVITLGGALNDEDEPYTISSIKGVIKNIDNATKPE